MTQSLRRGKRAATLIYRASSPAHVRKWRLASQGKRRNGYKGKPPQRTKRHEGAADLGRGGEHSRGKSAGTPGVGKSGRSRERSRALNIEFANITMWGPKAQGFVTKRGEGPGGPQALIFVAMHVATSDAAEVLGWLSSRGWIATLACGKQTQPSKADPRACSGACS